MRSSSVISPQISLLGYLSMFLETPMNTHSLVVLRKVHADTEFDRSAEFGSATMNWINLWACFVWVLNPLFFMGGRANQVLVPNILGVTANALSLWVRKQKRGLPVYCG